MAVDPRLLVLSKLLFYVVEAGDDLEAVEADGAKQIIDQIIIDGGKKT